MTRISMNDVSIVTPAFTGTGSQNTPKVNGSNFQDILNEQTDAGRLQDDTTQQDFSVESEDHTEVKTDNDTQPAAEAVEQKGPVTEETDVNNDGSQQEEDRQQENLNNVIGEILATLQQQIMDTLNIPEEEFQGMLEDLSMEAVDLLQSSKLSEFVLNATGAEDSLALLTNENLLQDYRRIMNQLTQLLEQGSQELDISVEELNGLIEEGLAETAMMENEMVLPDGDEMLLKPVAEDGGVNAEADVVAQTQTASRSTNTGDNVHSDTRGEQNHQQTNQEGPVFSFQNTVQSQVSQVLNQAVQEMPQSWAPDTQDIMNQIMDYMKIQVKPDMSNLEMQLHPASLGTVQVQLEANGDAITAKFITQNEAVRATLESQMVELKQQFQEQGVKVESIEVSVQTQTFGQSFEQGRQAEQAQEENKPRIRRINLNDLTAMDSAEEVEDADRIAVEMMNANGNTVDYMA